MANPWDIERLASSDHTHISLKENKVSVNQMRLISAIFYRVSAAAELEPSLLLIEGSKPNAAAGLVNGRPTVMINMGMLKLIGSESDQWAALLGHELAHLKLGHSDTGQSRRATLSLLTELINAGAGYDYATQYGTQIVAQLIDTKFSRDQERTSDYLGAIWAIEADYDPNGGAELHRKMYKSYGSKGIPFLSSHPTGPDRIKALSELADRLTPTDLN